MPSRPQGSDREGVGLPQGALRERSRQAFVTDGLGRARREPQQMLAALIRAIFNADELDATRPALGRGWALEGKLD